MKKKLLDIMIDFETFGLQVDSAPICLSAVAFDRDSESNPFVLPGAMQKVGKSILCEDEEEGFLSKDPLQIESMQDAKSRYFLANFNLTCCLFDGMGVDAGTLKWWAEKDKTVKDSLLNKRIPTYETKDLFFEFLVWLRGVKNELGADEVCLWAQGSDFDIAKFRLMLHRYVDGLEEEAIKLIRYTNYRDARTIILELGKELYNGKKGFSCDKESGVIFSDGNPNTEEELEQFNDIYSRIYPYEKWAKENQKYTGADGVAKTFADLQGDLYAHNPLYDCLRSIYAVWWLKQAIDTQMI